MNASILKRLYVSASKNSSRFAIWVNHQMLTYEDFFQQVDSLATRFCKLSPQNSVCAIYADRSLPAYVSLLAALLANMAYMPLNLKFPVLKNLEMIKTVKPGILCVDVNIEKMRCALQLLNLIDPMKIFIFNKNNLNFFKNNIPKHEYYLHSRSQANNRHGVLISFLKKSTAVLPTDIAYIMFTSGSTSASKGVAINHRNLSNYIDSILSLFKPTSEDRFAQFSDLSFDLSVHDLFVCWSAGGTLYVIPENLIYGLNNFIQEHQLTFWLSVPSTITLLKNIGSLKARQLSSLTQSFFCGEPLLQTQAKDWQIAAPNSNITNLYGPTEATISCTYFNWRLAESDLQPEIVPIGDPFPNQHAVVLNSQLQYCESNETGELYLTGSQVISSYLCSNYKDTDALLTTLISPILRATPFQSFTWDHQQKIWYRTGDLVQRHTHWGLLYVGRIDDQWQIFGYRVNRNEIENELRKIINHHSVAVVPIQQNSIQVAGIIAFIVLTIDQQKLIHKMRQTLPNFMIPKKIIQIKEIPKNANGKVDYLKLKHLASL